MSCIRRGFSVALRHISRNRKSIVFLVPTKYRLKAEVLEEALALPGAFLRDSAHPLQLSKPQST